MRESPHKGGFNSNEAMSMPLEGDLYEPESTLYDSSEVGGR